MNRRFLVYVQTGITGNVPNVFAVRLHAASCSEAIRLCGLQHPTIDWSLASAVPVDKNWKVPGRMLPGCF
jgi:hypothetical protein